MSTVNDGGKLVQFAQVLESPRRRPLGSLGCRERPEATTCYFFLGPTFTGGGAGGLMILRRAVIDLPSGSFA